MQLGLSEGGSWCDISEILQITQISAKIRAVKLQTQSEAVFPFRVWCMWMVLDKIQCLDHPQ